LDFGKGNAVADCHACPTIYQFTGVQTHAAGQRLGCQACAKMRSEGRGPEADQKPVSIRWNITLVKPAIWAPTKGAEKATARRMATIFGTKVRVISCTCVRA